MTLAGSLSTLLSSNWSLTGDLAASKIHFSTAWYDSASVKPQVTVTHLASPVGGFFGSSNLVLHSRFMVNCWLQIPRGATGDTEKGQIEDLRGEILRVINGNRHGVNSFAILLPENEGTPLHEVDKTPRVLRYEITVLGVENKP